MSHFTDSASTSTGPALSIAFVATCPPRQCGIATFTSDLARAIKAADPATRIAWAAINDADSIHPYGPEVRWRIRQRQPASYRAAAEALNASRVDLVSVQHEFGLYGLWGDSFEDHLAEFLTALRKPLVTTLHTVLPNPSPSVRDAIRRIGDQSRAVVVMAHLARQLLVERYGLDASNVVVIPHGVPAIEPRGRTRMKDKLGLRGRTIISTFGLVDPRKGLEYMIRAMGSVIEHHPDALYLVVGKTHPELVRREGEAYRRQLGELVAERGLGEHVAFVDQYLTQRQIVDYLLASDVYVTPYLDPNQITSGTLAYALGAGKAVVSTPYLHATEVLADGRGVLVDFRNEDQLARAVTRILDDPEYKWQLEQRAFASGHEMAWPNVGRRMLRLFRAVVSLPGPSGAEPAGPTLPSRRLARLANLTGVDQTADRSRWAGQGFEVESPPRAPAAIRSTDPEVARWAAHSVAHIILDGPFDGALLGGSDDARRALRDVLEGAGIRCFTIVPPGDGEPASRIVELGPSGLGTPAWCIPPADAAPTASGPGSESGQTRSSDEQLAPGVRAGR